MKLTEANTRTARRYIYRVASAALVVAAVYGFVNGEEAAAWLLVFAAVTGMADLNVPSSLDSSGPGNGA